MTRVRRFRDETLRRGIGERLRWIREECERKEPLQHGLEQWAKWLHVSAATLSRIENGTRPAPLELIDQICWITGASTDFVFWRLLSPAMDQWLRIALRKAHPKDVLEIPDFEKDREKQQRNTAPHREQRQRRRRLPIALEL